MYSESIMEYVRQALGYEADDESIDSEIEQMDRSDVLNLYLQWQGLIGYTDEILEVIEDIYDCSLEDRIFYSINTY